MKGKKKPFESFYQENQKPKRIDYKKEQSGDKFFDKKQSDRGFKAPNGYNKDFDTNGGKRSFDKPFAKEYSKDGDKKTGRSFDKPFNKEGGRSFDKPFNREGREGGRSFDKPFNKEGGRSFDKPFNREGGRSFDKPFNKEGGRSFDKPFNREGREGGRSFDKPFNREGREGGRSFDKPFNREGREGGRSFDKPFNKEGREGGRSFDKPFNKEGREGGRSFDKPASREFKPRTGDKPFGSKHTNASYGREYGKKKDNDESFEFEEEIIENGFDAALDDELEDFSYTPEYDDDETVRDQREEDLIIYGRNVVLESLERGEEFEKILILQGMRGEFEKSVRKICTDRNIPLQVVPKEKLNTVTNKNHQGVIGYVSPIAYQELETIYKAAIDKKEVPLFVLLDGVTDVRNIGAVARSAEISGAHAIIVSKKNVAAINATAVKVSAGALKLIPVCRVSSLMAAVDFLQLQGAQVLAADIEAKKQLRHMDFGKPTAIVMGAEGRGINRDLMSKMNNIFKIPMVGKTESYNVSVATGIVLYEAVRQRLD